MNISYPHIYLSRTSIPMGYVFFLFFMSLVSISTPASASVITLDNVSSWSSQGAPSRKRDTSLPEWVSDVWISGTWVGLGRGEPTKRGNSSGTLVSDVSFVNDFTFSGLFSPTIENNHTCVANNVCNDNDILGLVFGWEDENNHFRLGWSQADDLLDITGKSGMFLVHEQNGVSQTLLHWDYYWLDDALYDFSVVVENQLLSVNVAGDISDMMGDQSALAPTSTGNVALTSHQFSRALPSFAGGRIGVYTESQTAVFSNLAYSGLVLVNAPSSLAAFGLLCCIWSGVRRRTCS